MGYIWYKKGQELLTEISESRLPDDMAAFWYIGQMGMVIKWRNTVIYVDPVLGDMKGEDGKTRRNYEPPFQEKRPRRIIFFVPMITWITSIPRRYRRWQGEILMRKSLCRNR